MQTREVVFSGAWWWRQRWGLLIVLLAAGVRFWALDIKPAHFDEGINGWFADGMKTRGYFEYDPTNYHGPWHFYTVFASQALFGRSLWALRLPAVLASVGAVVAVLACGRFFGRRAVLWAAAAMAISPAFVFYGRYSIHESWVVLFNLLLFLGVLGWWKEGRARDVFLVCAGVAGLILNKETYLIQIGSLLLAFPCLFLWQRIVPGKQDCGSGCEGGGNLGTVGPCRKWTLRDLAWGVGWAVLAVVFFYSGTFWNWQGLHGLWQTWAAWLHTGVESGGHAKTSFDLWGTPLNWYWIWLMARYEWPALVGLAGAVACLLPCRAEWRLTAIYGCGLLLAYSLVPYKTPWCIISFLWPFFFLGAAWVESARGGWLWAGRGVLLVALAGSAVTMGRLNFRDFDLETEPYVYVQTYRDITRLTEPVLAAAERDPRNYFLQGQVLLESYYPLPWVWGDFPHVGYFGSHPWPETLRGDFIVADSSKRDAVVQRLEGDYVEIGFRFRDAQEPAVAFFRRDSFPDVVGTAVENKNSVPPESRE